MAPRQRRMQRPATTPEGRENQLITLAIDLAEKQLVQGTASAQVIGHFLKMASTREQLEQKRLENENLLLAAKIEQIHSGQRIEELYEKALGAMRQYAGKEVDDFDDD